MNYLVFIAVPVPLTTQEPAETKICQSCELYCMTKHNSFADVCNECQCEPPKGKYLQIPSFKIIIVFLQIITMHLDQKSNHPQCLRCIQTYLHLNAILIWKFPKQINTLIITSDIDFCKLNICLLKKITQTNFSWHKTVERVYLESHKLFRPYRYRYVWNCSKCKHLCEDKTVPHCTIKYTCPHTASMVK